MTDLTPDQQDKLDAAAFRRLIAHLQARPEVQNIELMILADFCRNCLSDWYADAAKIEGIDVSEGDARERVYGMPYAVWKENHQRAATPEQIAAFEARKKG